MDMHTVRTLFILPASCKSESNASDEMQQAFENCKQHMFNIKWIKENDKTVDFCETDFVVFQSFEGDFFEHVSKNYKSVRIVGPWCLLVCLIEGRPIPNLPWPVLNVAMSECNISCSHLSKTEKSELKNKIQTMGGIYTDNMTKKVTHLVTDSVNSQKYHVAAAEGVKLMTPAWVNAVWEESQKTNIHCTNEKFQIYRCLPFHKLTVCATGITSSTEKDYLQKLIMDNGGNFTPQLVLKKTDVLVCSGIRGSTSAKYKAARKSEIPCVTLSWVTDSVEKGYALSYDAYPVKKSTSTPTKGNEEANPDFSMMSVITPISKQPYKSVLEETVNLTFADSTSTTTLQIPVPTRKRKNSSKEEHIHLVNSIDFKKVKAAGAFLDGCSVSIMSNHQEISNNQVYLVGFEPEQRDKLTKVLNFSGATRYDKLTDRVTHVIVGDSSCSELKTIWAQKECQAAVVTIHWLLDSIDRQQPAQEAAYVSEMTSKTIADECSSPLSKKGLTLLRTDNVVIEKDLENKENSQVTQRTEKEVDIIQQYFCGVSATEDDTLLKLMRNEPNSKQTKQEENEFRVPKTTLVSCENLTSARQKHQTSENLNSASEMDEESSEPIYIFEGLKFLIVGFTGMEYAELKENIESLSGSVVQKSYRGVADYAVVPVFTSELYQTTSEIVNDFWIRECYMEKEIRDVFYYHQPIAVKNKTVLYGCVITLSGYTEYERNFLRQLVKELGGIAQEQFARIANAEHNILMSTHLVSSEASGKKYAAAIKWNLPVVDKDWLLECARTGRLVPEDNYLVGDAVGPKRQSPADHLSVKSRLCNTNGSAKACNSRSNEFPKQQSAAAASTITKQDSFADIHTPVREKKKSTTADQNSEEHTPPNKPNTPDYCSQVTPVNIIMEKFRQNNTMENSPLPRAITHMDTPETSLGACLRSNPSPKLRKEMARCIHTLPYCKPLPSQPRRNSTPLSELKKRLWEKVCPSQDNNSGKSKPSQPNFNDEDEDNNVNEVVSKPNADVRETLIDRKLQQLEEMVNASGSNRRSSLKPFESTVPIPSGTAEPEEPKDSQANTVGWDYKEISNINQQETITKKKVFMLSGIESDLRQEITEKLTSLGATVSELANYDPLSTHLICLKPSRNEKTLSSMAAGKWILHISYVDACVKAGQLLNEEQFEFGNPKADEIISKSLDMDNIQRTQSMHWWRKEVLRRGYGAFHDMRAIVVANKREPIIRVIEAGGGMVVDIEPPFKDTVYATHCLLEAKSVKDFNDYVPLAKQGIYCINTLYISDFLQRTAKDIKNSIFPHFTKYYSNINT